MRRLALEDVFEFGSLLAKNNGMHFTFANLDEFKISRKVIRGEESYSTPPLFRAVKGRRFLDFLSTDSGPFLMSRRVVDILTSAKFTGFSCFPVILSDRAGRELQHSYFSISVFGRVGPRDPQNPLISFDLDSWDGSDIFMTKSTDNCLALRSVIEAVTSIAPTNLDFYPIVPDAKWDAP